MASNPQYSALKAELGSGGSALPPESAFEGSDLAALTKMVREAKGRQRDTLNTNMEAALGHIPLLLRGAIKKLFFG